MIRTLGGVSPSVMRGSRPGGLGGFGPVHGDADGLVDQSFSMFSARHFVDDVVSQKKMF